MAFSKSFIPYGAYWVSPFCRWQGALASSHAIELAASTAARFFAARKLPMSAMGSLTLGTTVPQRGAFYGAPWLAAMLGAENITGPTLSQACATSARLLLSAASEVEAGVSESVLGIACDRTSNGPHLYYPEPRGIGGRGSAEDWVWDNFNRDPNAKLAMIQTAENAAKKAGIGREEQDEMALLRYEQYLASMAEGRAFQKRYMFPVEVRISRKQSLLVEQDEGIQETTRAGLAKLRPALPGGTCTPGAQTHPADGNAGIFVCSEGRAKELSSDPSIPVRLIAFGTSRVEAGYMPMAVAPAARAALSQAGLGMEDVGAIKTHNPFAINDVLFSKETGVDNEKVNRFGSPLVYGHPQGPTGLRAVVELIEELAMGGGGYGLFSGCAAGDTAMAVVVKVG